MIQELTYSQPDLQAHCQSPTSQRYIQSFVKELAKPTHGQKANAAKMKYELTGKINNETLTSGIKHWGLSGYSSFLPRIKFCVTGQDSSPQSPTISYRRPL